LVVAVVEARGRPETLLDPFAAAWSADPPRAAPERFGHVSSSGYLDERVPIRRPPPILGMAPDARGVVRIVVPAMPCGDTRGEQAPGKGYA
jgi:hypothetical protein